MTDKLNGLVFKSFEDVSTSVSKFCGVTSDNKHVAVSFIEGSCDIGIGLDKTEALRNRREQFNLPQGGDYISKNELFKRMNWRVE